LRGRFDKEIIRHDERLFGPDNSHDGHAHACCPSQGFVGGRLEQAIDIADRDDPGAAMVLTKLGYGQEDGELGGSVARSIAWRPRGVVDDRGSGLIGVDRRGGSREGEEEQRGGGGEAAERSHAPPMHKLCQPSGRNRRE
jgi:hypothetical protein